MSLPYYKMYPRDFHEGTMRLSLECKGAYIMLLNLMYTRNGPVEDEPGYLSKYIGCSIRKWQTLRLELIGYGKISSDGAMISNSRADEELLKRTSYVDQKRENRSGSSKNKDEEKRASTYARDYPEPDTEQKEEANASSKEPLVAEAIGSSKPFDLEAPPPSKPKPAKPRGERLPAGWVLPQAWIDLALAHRDLNFPDMQLTIEEIAHEGHAIAHWSQQPGANRCKTDWLGTWRNWISRGAPAIFERRLRAQRVQRPSAQRERAPTLQDALRYVASGAARAEACRAGQEPFWAEDGADAGQPQRPRRLEVIDFYNANDAGASQPRGDRGAPFEAFGSLPLAAAGRR